MGRFIVERLAGVDDRVSLEALQLGDLDSAIDNIERDENCRFVQFHENTYFNCSSEIFGIFERLASVNIKHVK